MFVIQLLNYVAPMPEQTSNDNGGRLFGEAHFPFKPEVQSG